MHNYLPYAASGAASAALGAHTSSLTLNVCCHAGTDCRPANAGTSAASLRGAFFDSFASYAVATDRLSLELSAQASTADDAPDEEHLIPADRKLLVLLSNCAFVRGSVMPSLIDRCPTLATCHSFQA